MSTARRMDILAAVLVVPLACASHGAVGATGVDDRRLSVPEGLGAAPGRGTVGIPPGGSWAFETSSVNDPGVNRVDFPAASLPPLE